MKTKTQKKYLLLALSLLIFTLISIFSLSIFTNNPNQSAIGTSKASALEPADINSDGKVDIFDLSTLLSNWNRTGSNTSDINSDGSVNIFDLSILLSKWGPVVTVTPTPTPVSGSMPTRDNTGPRYALTDMTLTQFYNTKTCNRQRINGTIYIDQAWMRGQTFNITDCEIDQIYVYLQGGGQQLPLADMPIINVDYTDILNGLAGINAFKLTIDHSYIEGYSQLTLVDAWMPQLPGNAPYTFINTLLYGFYAPQPTHTEVIHVAGYGTGSSYTNVVFMQQGGPMTNSGVTAVINYHGAGAVFDGCYFLWDGSVPSYYTVYIDGPGNVVRNSWFDSAYGGASYVYPYSAEVMPTFTNNRNYRTNQLLSLP